ncbi:MAG: sporulation protein YtxC, partial [Christensenellales bacterium]
KKLNMGSEDLLSRTLINTMCIFDNSYDKTAIKRNLENIRNFSLDGFYNFRLGDVKKKWDEIVVLSNSYDTVINDYDTMRDFLMFLLEAIPTLVNNLSVVFDEESGFELFDEKGLRLNKLTTLSVRQEPEEDLLYNLVCINPAAVNFYGDWQSMSEQFKDIADSLFVINDMKSAKIS